MARVTFAIVLVFALAGAACPSVAAAGGPAPPLLAPSAATTFEPIARSPTFVSLLRKRRNALLERNLGWGFAGFGFAALACGGVLFGTSYAEDVRFEAGSTNRTAGLIVMAAGLALLIPGAVMSVHGQKLVAENDWRLRLMVLSPVVAPLPGGAFVGAQMRF